jgi:sugar lactone lactonase YvrE
MPIHKKDINMTKYIKIKPLLFIVSTLFFTACSSNNMQITNSVQINGIAQNPEGIEFDKTDNTFLLSSINAGAIIKVNQDGTYKTFSSGESFPLSTAGIQIDYKRQRVLVAGFNGLELMDKDKNTKGSSFLRIYDLKTGKLQNTIHLSKFAPKESPAYFANDIAVDTNGNAYISDWYAGVIYKVDIHNKASLFWVNTTGIKSGPNGLDYKDGNLLVSILTVNNKGLYDNFGLVKIPLSHPDKATLVKIENDGYSGFDGMVFKRNGNIIGISNNQKTPGGNLLLELSSNNNWDSAKVINKKEITPSTTVALSKSENMFVINQDFSNNTKQTWSIEQIKF